ncbi:hypothetical protein NA56DRAFT_628355, partial [Hyaloscypha hepaticicola]
MVPELRFPHQITHSNRFVVSRKDSLDAKQKCDKILFDGKIIRPEIQKEALKTRRGKPVRDACKWIQDNDLVKAWRDIGKKKSNKKPCRLWISGGPAKGKTFFSLCTIEQLEARRKRAHSNFRICYFFFENDHSTAEEALKAMIGMLLDQINSPELYEATAGTLDRHKAEQLTFEPLWTIFRSLVQNKLAGVVYCIVDGLDECRPPSLNDLLRKFSDL